MKYAFKEHEKNYLEWCRNGYPTSLDQAKATKLKEFLRNIDNPNFTPPLFKHQIESLKRVIYCYEILGKKDLLVEVVTGGGKSVIIGGVTAYFMTVHDISKFLILVPNTIVRARLDDEFNPESGTFVYSQFPFFYNGTQDLAKRISLHMMEAGKDPVGIRSANIILGNIHQIYEAHNSKAENYNEVLNKLKPQRIFRLDTTATPDRLDGLHPDSEKILEYGIRQAMHDRIIKRIIVCKPDIEKVKLTYKDIETGQELKAEEIPWEEIENRKIRATKYMVSEKPMRQQIAIAKQCLDFQKKTVPPDIDGKPKWKPLLFVVAISIKDAKNIAKVLENEFKLKTLLVTNESEESEKEEAMELNRHLRDTEYDAVVSVLMLREGWDVKNISVILLFRKFCYNYNQYTREKYSVYGQQVIGRGLRRINPQDLDHWEQCLVVDHPVLQHDWLWEMLDADQYQGTLNPEDVIDIKKIPEPKPIDGGEVEQTVPTEKAIFSPDIGEIIDNIPNPPEEQVKVIHEWQEYLDNYQYQTEQLDIEQTIRDIKQINLASGFNVQEQLEGFKIDIQAINKVEELTMEELKTVISQELLHICRNSLMEYDRNPDKRQDLIFKVLTNHIVKRFLLGHQLLESEDHTALKKLWFSITEIGDVFIDPALMEGILTHPPES